MGLTVKNGEMNYFIVSDEDEFGDVTVQLTFADDENARVVCSSDFKGKMPGLGRMRQTGSHVFVDVDLDGLESMLVAAAHDVPGRITITNKCPCCGRAELEPQLVETNAP